MLESDAAGDGANGDSDDDEAEQSLGCASHAATVASAALADAGIEMWGLVVGLGASSFDEHDEKGRNSSVLVDAAASEAPAQQRQLASMTLWTMPALGTVTAMSQHGPLDLDELDRILAILQKASTHVHFVVARALQDGFAARREILDKSQM